MSAPASKKQNTGTNAETPGKGNSKSSRKNGSPSKTPTKKKTHKKKIPKDVAVKAAAAIGMQIEVREPEAKEAKKPAVSNVDNKKVNLMINDKDYSSTFHRGINILFNSNDTTWYLLNELIPVDNLKEHSSTIYAPHLYLLMYLLQEYSTKWVQLDLVLWLGLKNSKTKCFRVSMNRLVAAGAVDHVSESGQPIENVGDDDDDYSADLDTNDEKAKKSMLNVWYEFKPIKNIDKLLKATLEG